MRCVDVTSLGVHEIGKATVVGVAPRLGAQRGDAVIAAFVQSA